FKPGQARDTMAFGSLGYAPPEQYGAAQTTAQSDIYSLGVVLHELLSGQEPSQILPTFAPLGLTILPGLEALIARMVARDPAQRPGSMAEVKKQLQGLLEELARATGSAAGAAAAPPEPPAEPEIPPVLYDTKEEWYRVAKAYFKAGKYQESLDAYDH